MFVFMFSLLIHINFLIKKLNLLDYKYAPCFLKKCVEINFYTSSKKKNFTLKCEYKYHLNWNKDDFEVCLKKKYFVL